jgi:hypothetical protein
MKNQVIEVLNKEHGKKVIEYWKSKGVNTMGMMGVRTKKGGDLCRYYGVICGFFNAYSEIQAAENNAEIIELPKEEKPFPRVMLVSNKPIEGINDGIKLLVISIVDGIAISVGGTQYSHEQYYQDLKEEKANPIFRLCPWRYAKELPEKVELTKSEIAEKFGISIEQIVIKDD